MDYRMIITLLLGFIIVGFFGYAETVGLVKDRGTLHNILFSLSIFLTCWFAVCLLDIGARKLAQFFRRKFLQA